MNVPGGITFDVLWQFYEAVKKITRILDMDILQETILTTLKDFQPHIEAGSLWLVQGKKVKCTFSFGLAADQIRGVTLAKTEGVVGWVVTHKEYTVAESYKDLRHAHSVEEGLDFRSRLIICFPLIVGDWCFGAIEILDTHQNPDDLKLDAPYMNFLQQFVDIASVALSNAISYQTVYEDNVRKERLNKELKKKISLLERPATIIGESKVMMELYSLVTKYANSPYNVLIVGESGTGKELVARAIHDKSPRSKKPLLAENCAAIPEGLLESELFGYRKGAFTDAKQDKKGLFEEAHGGTVFLDEISSMPLGLQAKLLRVIQESKVKPLGAQQEIPVDVRIVAAGNRDLRLEVESGRFRDDLYYRLNVLPIYLPPLRERAEDFALLADHFLKRECAAMGMKPRKFSVKAYEIMEKYHWPGNIRELENVIKQILVTAADGDIIDPADIPSRIRAARKPHPDADDRVETAPGYPTMMPTAISQILPWDEFQRGYILSVLERTRWSVTKAADLLQLNRSTLFSKM
ncbi:MAG: sigma-54-dependent Fis family transcriptional regulator, partial [Deltaproteobacteria bacterium]|nr:sigma-54-dependent Fis family transcriptional regulator [Deltaproteobacteria bacterium]